MMIDLEKLIESVRQRDAALADLAKACELRSRALHVAFGVLIGLTLHPLVTDVVVWSGTTFVDYVFTVEPVVR